jgi:hypothetical protein
MPLDDGAELVLCCADCGALSSGDVRGASGWTLRRRSALRLLDICPACAPRARGKTVAEPAEPSAMKTTGGLP